MLKWINKKRNQKGFTLIELVVVIAILGVLAALAIPRLTGFGEKAKVSADQTLASTMANAAALYVVETNPTPTATGDALMALVAGAGLIDSTLTSEGAVSAKLTSASYDGFTIGLANNIVTVTLNGTGSIADFVVVK